MSFWSSERIDDVRRLAGEGYSASEIAGELRGGMTRNMVIGIARRQNIPFERGPGGCVGKGGRPRAPRSGPTPERKGGLQHARMKPAPALPPMVPAEPTAALDPADVPAAQRCSLLELTNRTCRFPYGDVGQVGFFFCGSPTADLSGGQPYCAAHTAISVGRSYTAQERRDYRQRQAGGGAA